MTATIDDLAATVTTLATNAAEQVTAINIQKAYLDNAVASVTGAADAAAITAAALTTLKNAYYGAFATAPTLRPDGTARQAGDRYFDSTASVEKVFNGTAWVRATITNDSVMGKATQADLYADLAHVADTIAYVTNDPAPAKNGTYRKTGASGTGAWEQSSFDRVAIAEVATAFLTLRADALESATETGKNLLNIYDRSAAGHWVNYVTGLYESYPTNPYIAPFFHSQPIFLEPGETYTRLYGSDGTTFFDRGGIFISGTQSDTFSVPASAAYSVINFQSNHLYEQVEKGSVSTAYELFGTKLKYPLAGSVNASALAAEAVGISATNFLNIGKNLYDQKSASAIDNWVNPTNGAYESYPTNPYIAGYHYSAPIFLIPGATYTRKYGTAGISFFTRDNAFISGSQVNTFAVPALTHYAVMNTEDYQPFDQLELGSVSTHYEPYGVKFRSGGAATKADIFALNLPPKIYAVVGKEVSVYFDNLMIDDAAKYNFNVDCSAGQQQDERWTATPSTAGTAALSVAVHKDYSDVYDILTMGSASVVTAAAGAGTGVAKTYLQIGDSTTKGMIELGTLADLFGADPMDLTLMGTQGASPNWHEGHPGKDTNYIYTNTASPFVFSGAFSFSQYMTAQGYPGLDFAGIHLGINDMYAQFADYQVDAQLAASMAQIEGMVTSIHAYSASIKIGILLDIPPSRSQDSFGANDPCGQTRWRYKRNIILWVRRLIAQFGGRESGNVYLVPFGSNLDTTHNMAQTTVAANSRTSVTVARQVNALHPDAPGYAQMSDAVYYWLKNMV